MIFRLFVLALTVSLTASCSILSALFQGGAADRDEVSVYQSAMADYSLCETAPDFGERAAAAARLSVAAQTMASVSQPTNPDHFYEMDRVVAADARCQAVMAAR